MIDRLLSFIAPHSCKSCGIIGRALCVPCASDMLEIREPSCIGCGTGSGRGVCDTCMKEWPVERAFVVGERTGILEWLINEFKFNRKRAVYRDLAFLGGSVLPFGLCACIVPVPTIAGHIRQRGYDHAALIARTLAAAHGLTYRPVLSRRNRSVQHGASKKDRLRQVDGAFSVTTPLDPAMLYIVFDDITTTGASLKEAARALKEAGAVRIWLLALARQPLVGKREPFLYAGRPS